MVHFQPLFVFLCAMGLGSETLCSVTLVAKTGDNVTIWCQYASYFPNSLCWYKYTCGSVPLLIGCKQPRLLDSPETCHFFTESERIVMSVYDKNTSLTITALNVSDTGLYYCGYGREMILSNLTSLRVRKGKNMNNPVNNETGLHSPAGYYTLAMSVILIFVLMIYLCCYYN